MNKLTPIAAALMLLSGAASATTFGPLTATPNPTMLSGGSATVNFNIPLSHADNVPGSCGLQLDYGDGSKADNILAHITDTTVGLSHAYANAGTFTVTITPASVVNPAGATRPPCSGVPGTISVKVSKEITPRLSSDPGQSNTQSSPSTGPVATLTNLKFTPGTVTLPNNGNNTLPFAVSALAFELSLPVGAVDCGIKIDATDGTPSSTRVLHPGSEGTSLTLGYHFSNPGQYTYTVTGYAVGQTPPCKASKSASITVNPGTTSSTSSGGDHPRTDGAPGTAANHDIAVAGGTRVAESAVPQPTIFTPTLQSATLSPSTVTLSKGKTTVVLTIERSIPTIATPCGIKVESSDGGWNGPYILPTTNPVTIVGSVQKAGQQTITVRGQAYTTPNEVVPACKGGAVKAYVTVNAEPSTLASLKVLPNGKGTTADAYIEDTPLSVNVSGDANGACGYRVTGENLANHNTVKSKVFTSFGTHEVFTFKGHTKYRVSVEGEKAGDIPACKGHLSQDIAVTNDRAWITGMKVEGNIRYAPYQAIITFRPNALDIKDGKPCSYELEWQWGGYTKTYSMPFKGLPPKVANGRIDGQDASIVETMDLPTETVITKPSLINEATLTVKGAGENACNGKISKTIVLPIPVYQSGYSGPYTVK